MIIKTTCIDGCFEIFPQVRKDERGLFVKTFHKVVFKENGFETDWSEEYYSLSKRGVLRGLHFQTPPYEHVKLVYCVAGSVLDAVVDLRVGSPTYGQHQMFDLNEEKANMIYIPCGLAHGFYTMSEKAIMMYKVSTVYTPDHDTGILWNSAGIPWPDTECVISDRDKEFSSLANYQSPFTWREKQ